MNDEKPQVTASSTVKLCIDCAFCTDEGERKKTRYLRCDFQIDEVGGRSRWFCDTARTFENLCGETARWWEDALAVGGDPS